MAATYWNGSTGALDTAGNWTNGVPSASNTPAVFDGRSQQSVTSGLGQGVTAFQLKTTRDYRGDIGASGNPLIWNGQGGTKWNTIRGSGTVHLQPNIATQEQFVIDALRGRVAFTTCKLQEVVVKAGTLDIGSTVIMGSRMHLVGVSAVTTLEEQATSEAAPTELLMTAGLLFNKRIFNETNSNISISGGTIKQTGVLGSAAKVFMHGGVIKYDPLASVSGREPGLFLLGGLFDFSGADQAMGLGKVYIGPDGALRSSPLDTEAAVITFDFRQDFP